MNKGTITGLVGGVCLILISCFLAGSIKAFVNIPSFIIVLGGSTASVVVAFPLDSLKEFAKTLKSLFKQHSLGMKSMIDQFVDAAKTLKKNGKMALEKVTVNDPFMRKGMDFVMANLQPDILEKMLQQERDAFYETEIEGQKILDKLAAYSPAWGMIGTLIGLVVMMLKLDDPSAIGPSMAVALITTFYGAIFANLVFMPLAYIAESRAKSNYIIRGVIIEGILSLANEESPRMIEDRLNSFIQHDLVYRKQLEKETAGKKEEKA